MAQNLFDEVLSKADFLNYGPERIDLERLRSKINEQNFQAYHLNLQKRLKTIQEYLQKIKLLVNGFPEDLNLQFELKSCASPQALIDALSDPIIQKYNQILCDNQPLQLKIGRQNFFTQPSSQDSMTFRDAYVKYLQNQFDKWKEKPSISERDIKTVLNDGTPIVIANKSYTGYELFKQALKEEMRSVEFQRGVFLDGIQHYQTDADISKRPIFCLLGPSGSGKSFSRDIFFRKQYPPGTQNNLLVVSADNSIARQNSKVLAITKQVMEASGIKIKDLDRSSKGIYKDVKKNLRAWAMSVHTLPSNMQVGLFIPETFSRIDVKPRKKPNLFKQISSAEKYLKKIGLTKKDLDSSSFFLGSISHQNNKIFRSIVKVKAQQRAYPSTAEIQNKKQHPEPFNFHASELKEYKKYPINESLYGVFSWSPSFSQGLKKAKEVMDVFQKEKLPVKLLSIENDLILVTQCSDNQWRECSDKETFDYSKKHLTEEYSANYQILSRAIWKEWQKQTEFDLIQFEQANRGTAKPKITFLDKSQEPKAIPLYKNTRHVSPGLQTKNKEDIHELLPEEDINELLQKVTDRGLVALALFCLEDESIKDILPQFYELSISQQEVIKKMHGKGGVPHVKGLFKSSLQQKDPDLVKVLERVKIFD